MISPRTLVLVLASLLLAGCMTTPSAEIPPTVGALALDAFFQGQSQGEGRIEGDAVGGNRTFVVDTTGTWDGRTLTLRESIRFADGGHEQRTWRFTKQRNGRYKATREGLVGIADAWQDGKTVRLSYAAEVLDTTGRRRVLTFEEVLVPQSENVVVAKTVASRRGLRVGTIETIYRRN